MPNPAYGLFGGGAMVVAEGVREAIGVGLEAHAFADDRPGVLEAIDQFKLGCVAERGAEDRPVVDGCDGLITP